MAKIRWTRTLSSIDGQLRSASGSEITQLFAAVKDSFGEFIREQISLGGGQVALLVNIMSRDGNSIARISWIEKLYANEHDRLSKLSKELVAEIKSAAESDKYDRGTRLSIYKDCFDTAYSNDLRLNREAKISDDERMVLNTLSDRLGMSRDEAFAIEHILHPVPKGDVLDALNSLREIGVIFINRRQSEVLIADQVVSILHRIQDKVLADKHILRILRSLDDPELSHVLRRHGQKSRGVTRQEKIRYIASSGIPIKSVLARDMFDPDDPVNKRKERLKNLIDDLGISTPRLGMTLDDRITVLIESLKSGAEREFNALSASGFKELVSSLATTVPPVLDRLREEFEIEDNETLDPERLRALGISPLDILYVYSNDEIRQIRDSMGLSKRSNPRLAILESFASANDRLIENYEMLACRDIAGLNAIGIEIKEPELGLKFEEITRTIFEQLGQNVDEDLRKQINTSKDKADIIISLSDDDVIIGEVKSYKNGDFAKYSSTSRQVKAYVNRCESNGRRVAQVLIVAPTFSQDFVDSAEMDADVNISGSSAELVGSIAKK